MSELLVRTEAAMCVRNETEANTVSEIDTVSVAVAELRALHKEDPQQVALKLFDLLEAHTSMRHDAAHAEHAGHVVGLAIGEGLVDSIPLCIALRHVLESLNEDDANSKKRVFGIAAISNCHQRLPEWPEFARSILDTAALSAHEPLRAQVQASVQSKTFTYSWTRAAVSQA
jgi:5'-deoxynucleotidase YfbR-like HD superfamily hydrolase